MGGCLTDLRQVQGTLNIAAGEECLYAPLGYYPWWQMKEDRKKRS